MTIPSLRSEPTPAGLGHLLQVIGKPSGIGSIRPKFARDTAASVAISTLGAGAGFLETRLGEIEDVSLRRQAQAGLRAIVGALGASSGVLLDITVALRRRDEESPDSLARVLEAADRAASAELTVEGFARSFERIERAGIVGGLVDRLAEQVRQIASMDGRTELRQQVLDDLLAQADAALAERGEASAALDGLFDELEYQDTLLDKAELLRARAKV